MTCQREMKTLSVNGEVKQVGVTETAAFTAGKQLTTETEGWPRVHSSASKIDWLRPVALGFLNIAAATSIVFANKAVSFFYGFNFTVTLTLCHTLTTFAGLLLFCQLGVFKKKEARKLQVPLILRWHQTGVLSYCTITFELIVLFV